MNYLSFFSRGFVLALLATISVAACARGLDRCPAAEMPSAFDPANAAVTRSALKGAPSLFYLLGKDRRAQLAAALKKDDPNVCAFGSSLLELSAIGGDVDEVRLLLDAGANPNRPLSESGTTPLAASLSAGRSAVATLLLDRGADPRIVADGGMSPLHELAATGGQTRDGPSHPDELIAIAQRLISAGVPVDLRGPQNNTPLMLATLSGRRDLIAFLLHKGADVTLVNARGNTASALARKKGDLVTLSMLEREPLVSLLRAGRTDDFVRAVSGCTAPEYPARATSLMFAALSHRNVTAVHALAKCGADLKEVSLVEHEGQAMYLGPLGYAACVLNDLTLVQALVEAGADVNQSYRSAGGDFQLPVLQGVVSMKRFEMAEYLLDHGADANAVDRRQGKTLLMAVAGEEAPQHQSPALSLIKSLLLHGAKVDARSNARKTALHFASMAGNAPAVELLLERGADAAAVDSLQHTPLFYAQQAHADDVIATLRRFKK